MSTYSVLRSPSRPSANPRSDNYDAEYASMMAELADNAELMNRLSTLPAGPMLASVLHEADGAALTDNECVAFAAALRRQQGWNDALLTRVTARFVEHRPGPPPEFESLVHGSEKRVHLGGELTPACGSFAAAEWGAANGISTWAASRLLADSLDLDVRLPALRGAMWAGICDFPIARMVASRTRDFSAETTARVEEAVLPRLPGLTRAQLELVIAEVAAEMEPATLARRAAQVRDKREVWIDPTHDDHAEIAGTLDTSDGRRLDARLDELARALGVLQRAGVSGWGPADGRRETFQQRRARALGLLADPDSVIALVRAARSVTHPHVTAAESVGDCTSSSGLRSTVVYVHIRPEGTCDVEGGGVLTLPTVRDLLASTAVTVRPVIDLNEDTESAAYAPSETLSEKVIVRSPTCVFPYCERPSRACQLDHTVPWPHGPTCTCNLGPLCQHHHHVKTHGAWTVRHTSPGTFRWRSPTDNGYVVDPMGTRRE